MNSRILVVDDEEIVRRSCLRTLGDGGHEQAVFCDRYVADLDRPYDPSFEGYNPLSQKEIDAMSTVPDDATKVKLV